MSTIPMSAEPEADRYGMYRTTILCWRCWCRYTAYAPGEFADFMVFYCDGCGACRVASDGEIGRAKRKFLDVHYPSIRGWGGKKENEQFFRVFEERWSEQCSCNGRFRSRAWPICPRCHAKPIRWLSWGSNDVVTTPPIPTLKFSIPPDYANAPGRPSLHPDPTITFVPGPLLDVATAQAQRAEAAQESPESRRAFEERIVMLIQERLTSWTSRLTQVRLTVELGPMPIRREATKTIPYASEHSLIVRREDQLVETIQFAIYHAGRRAATETEFTHWLDRTLQLVTEGKLVSKLVP